MSVRAPVTGRNERGETEGIPSTLTFRELDERLGHNLTDALARHPERVTDLFEGAQLLTFEPVGKQ